MIANPATPPTTPPAIAPAFELEELLDAGELLDVGELLEVGELLDIGELLGVGVAPSETGLSDVLLSIISSCSVPHPTPP